MMQVSDIAPVSNPEIRCPASVFVDVIVTCYLLEVPPRFELGNGGFADTYRLNTSTEHQAQGFVITKGGEMTGKDETRFKCPQGVS